MNRPEPVSKTPQHDFHAAQPDHAEEIPDVIFPAVGQAAVDLQPGEQPLDGPASAVAAQRPTVLRRLSAVAAVRRDHLDPVLLSHLAIQSIAVVGLVPDQSRRKLVEETVADGLFDQLRFVRRSSLDTDGDR